MASDENLPRTRKEAKERGLPTYFTGKPCLRGHNVESYTNSAKCVACIKEKNKKTYDARDEVWLSKERKRKAEWARQNREQVSEYHKGWYRRVKADKDAKNKAWRETNKERSKALIKAWKRRNRDRSREINNKSRRNNLDKFAARQKLRHTRKLRVAPAWLTQEQLAEMNDLYQQSLIVFELTGIKHHVDHIEPLQGEDRCGLHVPWNLQILPAFENISKGNRAVRHVRWKKT